MEKKKRYSISYRKALEADRAFLLSLYISTRDDLTRSLTYLPEQELRSLIETQYTFQDRHYKSYYPKAECFVIQILGKDIGRLYIDNSSGHLWIIDITIDEAYRHKGIGRNVMEEMISKARKNKKEVKLHVAKNNSAIHLYKQLGFVTDGERDLYYSMTRRIEKIETEYQSKECLISQ